jgi:hypothetical protein
MILNLEADNTIKPRLGRTTSASLSIAFPLLEITQGAKLFLLRYAHWPGGHQYTCFQTEAMEGGSCLLCTYSMRSPRLSTFPLVQVTIGLLAVSTAW